MCGVGAILEGRQRRAADAAGTTDGEQKQPSYNREELLTALKDVVSPRGPAHYGTTIPAEAEGLTIVAAVLPLRGETLVPQPQVDTAGNVLAWNGELFGGLPSFRVIVDNDTRAVAEAFGTAHDIRAAAEPFEGPWAFVYWQASTHCLWFGRDKLGRRSLVVKVPETDDQPLLIASVVPERSAITSAAMDADSDDEDGVDGETAPLRLTAQQETGELIPGKWCEVPTSGIWCVHADRTLHHHRWHTPYVPAHGPLTVIPPAPLPHTDVTIFESACVLLRRLAWSMYLRVASIPTTGAGNARVAILFSGGLDSIVLAAMAHFFVPVAEPIDLLNVCFDAARQSPDRLSGISGVGELRAAYPSRQWRFIRVDSSFAEAQASQSRVLQLLQPRQSHMDFNIGTAFWTTTTGCGHCEPQDMHAPTATTDPANVAHAVLFPDSTSPSGGLATANQAVPRWRDSAMALPAPDIVARLLPHLSDVLTSKTAPKKVDKRPAKCTAPGCRFQTKPSCVHSLCRKCCVKVQASEGPCNGHRLRPRGTAAAFDEPADAAAGSAEEVETKAEHVEPVRVQTTAKVLLVGIGSDEQLGGYARHRTAFGRGGWETLGQELLKDMTRLWTRNLGRDDRCCSDHGLSVRFPYLDESLMAWIQSCPLPVITDPRLPRGVGDKRLLRLVGRFLGLTDSTCLAKRAIQFGSRIAKQSNVHTFGSNRQAKGSYVYCPTS